MKIIWTHELIKWVIKKEAKNKKNENITSKVLVKNCTNIREWFMYETKLMYRNKNITIWNNEYYKMKTTRTHESI